MPKLLLTGPPGCGKTTIIQRVLAKLAFPAGGFYTQEVRQDGARLGFDLLTLDGQRGVLARLGLHSPQRVGKYGVDLQALDEIGVGAIHQAIKSGWLVVIDEVGPMELHSTRFRTAVLEALESPHRLLATVVQRKTPFTDAIKRRPDVTLIEVHPGNREVLVERLLRTLDTDFTDQHRF
jgi:nucleoside-triphosphatase